MTFSCRERLKREIVKFFFFTSRVLIGAARFSFSSSLFLSSPPRSTRFSVTTGCVRAFSGNYDRALGVSAEEKPPYPAREPIVIHYARIEINRARHSGISEIELRRRARSKRHNSAFISIYTGMANRTKGVDV